MSAYKSEFLQVLEDRGFIHQVSDPAGLDARASTAQITAYVGFDATASSLHIGNLLSIMMLRWLQKTGHRPIALMGGGTSKIGDPSGKDTSRTLLTDAQIMANIASIRTVFSRFLDFDAGAMMADNAEWLDRLHYIPFLRDVGRHFTINKMLTFDSVKLRLEREQPLTFLEFNYMILQAYDFVELYKRHGCILQMGGSDQWGNIVNGIDLGRRLLNVGLFALTTPLLTTSSGSKMGKTETGAVWLNADAMSPYDYWQFWRNCEDGDVGRLLKLFTELPLEEIGRLEGARTERGEEGPGHRGNCPLAWPRGRRASGRNSAPHLRGRRACGDVAHGRNAARNARSWIQRARRRCSCRLGVVQGRRTPTDQRRWTAGQRRRSHGREDGVHAARPHAGRCHQALARQEAARAVEAGVSATQHGRRQTNIGVRHASLL